MVSKQLCALQYIYIYTEVILPCKTRKMVAVKWINSYRKESLSASLGVIVQPPMCDDYPQVPYFFLGWNSGNRPVILLSVMTMYEIPTDPRGYSGSNTLKKIKLNIIK